MALRKLEAHVPPDLGDESRQSITRIEASPFVVHKGASRGFVYEIETGRLREVR